MPSGEIDICHIDEVGAIGHFLGSGAWDWRSRSLVAAGAGGYTDKMPTVSLRAHYDGERIQLDEPFDLPSDVPLLVTVLVPEPDKEREAWIAAGREALARAYGDAEPEYVLADIRR
ncbi:MAG: hypothetical protein ABMA15_10220 [Vicinamibacterales bacterium]